MLYSLPVHGNLISCVNLDILMSSAGGLGYWKPLPSVIPLTGQHADKFLIHEKKVIFTYNACVLHVYSPIIMYKGYSFASLCTGLIF